MGEKDKRTSARRCYVDIGALGDAPNAADSQGTPWVYVGDSLPELPETGSIVPVVMSMFDEEYEKIMPGNGAVVVYGYYDGEKFKQVNTENGSLTSVPIELPVTHWQYEQKPVQKKL